MLSLLTQAKQLAGKNPQTRSVTNCGYLNRPCWVVFKVFFIFWHDILLSSSVSSHIVSRLCWDPITW